jgi:probable HAF family extracellular repeat protein
MRSTAANPSPLRTSAPFHSAWIAALALAAGAARAQSIIPVEPLPGHTSTMLFAVSHDGLSVAGLSGGSTATRAIHWSNATGLRDLGMIPQANHAAGFGISGDGSAVAGRAWNETNEWAFRWTSPTGMINLGGLRGSISGTSGNALSFDGAIVVGRIWHRRTCAPSAGCSPQA